jgi:nondiscriminating glutamyl-tRNA synthetase
MNYLFARQKKGTFVVRIEDTDTQRNYDPQAKEIISDLTWLGLLYDEGPGKEGAYAPYFQSERTPLYQKALETLIEQKHVYHCFCSEELLEKKRKRQTALKQPPRYDRACTKLSEEQLAAHLAQKDPFIWRFRLDENQSVTVDDLAHGITTFELKNFSDFPLTRSDNSFTFIFANFVDDMLMKITHIFRGEDHLSNSACQAALFKAFNTPLPKYWHQPMICNIEGKKLSKRDFGFSLRDLQEAGFLPEAIINYLTIIGSSFKQELMNKDELINALNFDQLNTTGQIKYDVEKLQWINRKWISTYDPKGLTALCLPFLVKAYPDVASMNIITLTNLIQAIKTEMVILADCVKALHFYFTDLKINAGQLTCHLSVDKIQQIQKIVKNHLAAIEQPESFLAELKQAATKELVTLKDMYYFLRIALTGTPNGPAIGELIQMLGIAQSKERIEHALQNLVF